MERSWSLPVAQALQRHTGSWKASPPVDGEAGRREPEQTTAVQGMAGISILGISVPASDRSAAVSQIILKSARATIADAA